jgi:hypothetical protein
VSTCSILLFKAGPGNMALLLAIEAASFGKQLFPFVFIHCIDFGHINIHRIRIFLEFEAPTALLPAKGLALALAPIIFKAEGTLNFGPQLVLAMCGILPFDHGDRSQLDFFKYGTVK